VSFKEQTRISLWPSRHFSGGLPRYVSRRKHDMFWVILCKYAKLRAEMSVFYHSIRMMDSIADRMKVSRTEYVWWVSRYQRLAILEKRLRKGRCDPLSRLLARFLEDTGTVFFRAAVANVLNMCRMTVDFISRTPGLYHHIVSGCVEAFNLISGSLPFRSAIRLRNLVVLGPVYVRFDFNYYPVYIYEREKAVIRQIGFGGWVERRMPSMPDSWLDLPWRFGFRAVSILRCRCSRKRFQHGLSLTCDGCGWLIG